MCIKHYVQGEGIIEMNWRIPFFIILAKARYLQISNYETFRKLLPEGDGTYLVNHINIPCLINLNKASTLKDREMYSLDKQSETWMVFIMNI